MGEDDPIQTLKLIRSMVRVGNVDLDVIVKIIDTCLDKHNLIDIKSDRVITEI